MIVGIDYGSKMAGTTVVCYEVDNELAFRASQKSKSADIFLAETLVQIKATKAFIDAPLSLPGAYYGKGENYHFRNCDIQTQAMSPMFLGGLTARAMKLTSSLKDIEFFESYPAFLMKTICQDTKEIYTKKLKLSNHSIDWLKAQTGKDFAEEPVTWHHYDATLAWLTGARFIKNEALAIGEEDEGIIWV